MRISSSRKIRFNKSYFNRTEVIWAHLVDKRTQPLRSAPAANAADRYKSIYYDGGHKCDRKMQADAFDWFDRFLKAPAVQH
jgi:hypothetical protein